MDVAVTKILGACVYVLGSSLPVLILVRSSCDATKQNRVYTLSLVSI